MSKAGPTGKYPQGKLTPTDGGELQISISIYQGKIVLDFGVKVDWVGLDPDHADEFAVKMMEAARMIREEDKK